MKYCLVERRLTLALDDCGMSIGSRALFAFVHKLENVGLKGFGIIDLFLQLFDALLLNYADKEQKLVNIRPFMLTMSQSNVLKSKMKLKMYTYCMRLPNYAIASAHRPALSLSFSVSFANQAARFARSVEWPGSFLCHSQA